LQILQNLALNASVAMPVGTLQKWRETLER